MRYQFILMLMLLSGATLFGQVELKNQLKGDWVIDKVQLSEAVLLNLDKPIVKNYKDLPDGDRHFLFNDCLLRIMITDNESVIETANLIIKDAEIEVENNLISFRDATHASTTASYFYEFISENQLKLTSQEVFYNGDTNQPLKAVLTIFLIKQ